MLTIGLVIALLCSSEIGANPNVTETKSDAEFSIDEVSQLNRQFLEFLIEYDASEVVESDDLRCVRAFQQLSKAYLNRERHGLEWFDSWGKIPSGLYYENGYALGNYEQCRRYRWQEVRGQHCTLAVVLPGELPVFFSGMCVPQHCSQQFLTQVYGAYMLGKGAFVLPMDVNLCNQDRDVEFNGAVITAMVIFIIIVVLVVCSTLYEVIQLIREEEVRPLFASFSLFRNVRSILHITPRITDPAKKMDMIECANGIRALSMVWIVVLHVIEATFAIPYSNPTSRKEWMRSFPVSIMYNTGILAVDTFLALSGMLVSYNMLRELDKRGKINPLMMYLRRYIRISAPLAPLILLVVSFGKYLGEGPLWSSIVGREVRACSEYWWSALLYIQNYVNPRSMCLPWTWYLSVDMQLYIVAPLLIYPLWRWGKRVLLAIGFLAVLSIGCVFTTFLVNDFQIHDVGDGSRHKMTYYPTHARMSVWLLGTIFGYILHKTKATGVKLPARYYTIGWASCFAALGLIIYATYEMLRTDFHEYSGVADAFYEALSRSVFAICVMWIIFACVNGQGGVIDDMLSSSLFQPLAKLSYTMYLLHLLLVMMSVANAKTDVVFSVMDIFYRIWGAIGLSTSVSLLWSAIFEVSFGTLERCLLRR
ncbi:nose resistant to fluoxetine protein 6-like [Culex pipiens pallens]|uniref:nose resistant to fluoxetine protein 6-like n=1 Tax=Culex pipiens pallens TaxID=42434 RepID=UPI001953245F|nr:nose resistant to fluoxetine protein 6-like [Culex pipiens pallens]